MRVSLATDPAKPGTPNEDFAAVSADAAVLLDGAGTPPGSDSGCVHGVAWYARTLGAAYLARISGSDTPLADALADAIGHVRALHADTCDLNHSGSPSATVVAVRMRAEQMSYLVLADSVLAMDLAGERPKIVTDDRESRVGAELRKPMDALASGTAEHGQAHRTYVETMRGARNRPGGFWVAAVDPQAAQEALTGRFPAGTARSVALLSDGASRLADRFHVLSWPALIGVLNEGGPADLIARTRAAENSDPEGRRWPRAKPHDDATAVHITL